MRSAPYRLPIMEPMYGVPHFGVQRRVGGGGIANWNVPDNWSPAELSALSQLPSIPSQSSGPQSPTVTDWAHAAATIGGMAFPPLGALNTLWNFGNGLSSGFDQKTDPSAAPAAPPPSYTGNNFVNGLLSGDTSVGNKAGNFVGRGLGWVANQFNSPSTGIAPSATSPDAGNAQGDYWKTNPSTVQAPDQAPTGISADNLQQFSQLPNLPDPGTEPLTTVQAPNLQPPTLSSADLSNLSRLPSINMAPQPNSPTAMQSAAAAYNGKSGMIDMSNPGGYDPVAAAANRTMGQEANQFWSSGGNATNIGGADFFNSIGLSRGMTPDNGGSLNYASLGGTDPGYQNLVQAPDIPADQQLSGEELRRMAMGMGIGTDKNGGPVRRDLGGGIGGPPPTAATENPQMQDIVQRYATLPVEKLQELSQRMRGTPYAPIIQKILQQKQSQPQAMVPVGSTTNAPEAPQVAMSARGGALRRAPGGDVSASEGEPSWTRSAANEINRPESGFLSGSSMGRADAVSTTAPAGAYILPADVISGLGEGNSLAGARAVEEMLASGPWGTPKVRPHGGSGPPRAPAVKIPNPEVGQMEAKGGGVKGPAPTKRVPVLLSHGEFQIGVPHVIQIGRHFLMDHAKKSGKNGAIPTPQQSLKAGHKILDAFVLDQRKQHIAKLKSLPGPVKT